MIGTQQLKYKPFSLVVAVAKNEGIGFKGDLPWPKIPKEMKHFVNVTSSKDPLSFSTADQAMQSCFFQSDLKLQRTSTSPEKVNAVVMGRKTWESIPS